MSYSTLTFTENFTFDADKNYFEISLQKKEYVSNFIIQFGKLSKEFRFLVAFSDDNFATSKYIWSNSSHSRLSLSVGTGSSTTANTNYISYDASSTEMNRCEILYKNVTNEEGTSTSSPKRFMATQFRIYPAASSVGTTFEVAEIKPVIVSLSNDYQGDTMELSQNLTIRTNSTGSDVLQIDASGLAAWSGPNSSQNYTKITALGLEQYTTKDTGSATSPIKIGYLGTSSGNDIYGMWAPKIFIGGATFDAAPLQVDDAGNVSMTTANTTVEGSGTSGIFTLKNGSGTVTFQCLPDVDTFRITGSFDAVGASSSVYDIGTDVLQRSGFMRILGVDAGDYGGGIMFSGCRNNLTASAPGTIIIQQHETDYLGMGRIDYPLLTFNKAGSATFAVPVTISGATVCSSTLVVTGAFTASSTSALQGATTVSGALTASSTLVVKGAFTASSTVDLQGVMTGVHMYPAADNTYDIGSSSVRYRSISAGSIKIGRSNEIWENLTAADNGAIYINHTGYACATTYFRDFYVRDGKNADCLFIDGSAKTSKFSTTLTVANAFTASSTSALQGTTTVSGAFTASSTATFQGALTASSTTALQGTTTVSGALTASSTLVVKGAFTASSTTALQGTVDISGALAVSSTANFQGAITASSSLTMTAGAANQLIMSDYRTTQSHARFGSLEIQGYAVNDSLVGDNIYYVSGVNGWTYRNNGYGNLFYMDNGYFHFDTFPSGLAGASATRTERMRITNAGLVGIGTSTPTCLMHLSGNNASYRGQLSIASTDYSQITFYYGSTTTTDIGSSIYRTTSIADGNFEIANYGSGSVTLWLNGSEKVRFFSTGAVSIGTATASLAKFHVLDGGMTQTVLCRLSADDANPYGLVVANNTASPTTNYGLRMFVTNTGISYIDSYTSGSAADLYINNNAGRVGVGAAAVHASASLSVSPDATYTYGVYSSGTVAGGSAVYGYNPNGYGVRGYASNSTYYAVYGLNTTGHGVYGQTTATAYYGVYGLSYQGYGVVGIASNASYYGVYGGNPVGNGVYGYTTAANYSGVYGINNTGAGYGVYGIAYNGYGLYAYASNTTYAGAAGLNSVGHGVRGYSSGTGYYGVYGSSTDGSGVYGYTGATGGAGLYGSSSGAGYGVYAISSSSSYAAGYFRNYVGNAIYAYNSATGIAVIHASTTAGVGIYGYSNTGYGVSGYANAAASRAINGVANNVDAYSGYFTGGKFNITLPASTTGALVISGLPATSTSVSMQTLLVDTTNGNIFRYTSSARYKQNVKTIDIDERYWALRPVYYDSLGCVNQNNVGLIAEEVNPLYPVLVSKDAQARPDGVMYSQFGVLAVAATQHLKSVTDRHEAEIQDLKTLYNSEMESVRKELAELKALLTKGA